MLIRSVDGRANERSLCKTLCCDLPFWAGAAFVAYQRLAPANEIHRITIRLGCSMIGCREMWSRQSSRCRALVLTGTRLEPRSVIREGLPPAVTFPLWAWLAEAACTSSDIDFSAFFLLPNSTKSIGQLLLHTEQGASNGCAAAMHVAAFHPPDNAIGNCCR